MYPDIDVATVTLSNEVKYLSATFVKLRGKEHLAAACKDDGCLYLWDVEAKAGRTVFDPKIPKEKRTKKMNICQIDDSTIGYGEVYPSPDGSRSVYILKRNTAEGWTLCETLRLFTPHDIWDMCHTEILDGMACLLLCIPIDNRIMAVETGSMVGPYGRRGKNRWERNLSLGASAQIRKTMCLCC